MTQLATTDMNTPPPVEKLDHSLSPNIRALRLAIGVGESLLSIGVSASDAVNLSLTISDTYCTRRANVDVNSTSITISQDRGLDREPLTLIRNVVMRDTNNLVVQSIEDLVRAVKKGLPLSDAEAQLRVILDNPARYPVWLRTVGSAGVSAGVCLLFTSSWIVILTTFIIACLVDRLIYLLTNRAIPPFFIQIAAAIFITLSAVGITALGKHGIEPFVGISPGLIVVGGIVMLVAGLSVVATARDAIDEYYVTASARALKTAMMTAGIVIGIMLGIYLSKMLGQIMTISPDPIPLGDPLFQVLGAVIISVSWAIYIQARRSAIVWAGIIGGLAWLVYLGCGYIGMTETLSNGMAAFVVGFMAAITARIWKSPTNAIIDGAIVPLVPGLGLYNGLMQIVVYPAGTPNFVIGIGTLFIAMSVALAIATGATFGNIIASPIPKSIRRTRAILVSTHRRSMRYFPR